MVRIGYRKEGRRSISRSIIERNQHPVVISTHGPLDNDACALPLCNSNCPISTPYIKIIFYHHANVPDPAPGEKRPDRNRLLRDERSELRTAELPTRHREPAEPYWKRPQPIQPICHKWGSYLRLCVDPFTNASSYQDWGRKVYLSVGHMPLNQEVEGVKTENQRAGPDPIKMF